MGFIPFSICLVVGGCIYGCLVTDKTGWEVQCAESELECRDRATKTVACLWDGLQTGGKKFNNFVCAQMLVYNFIECWKQFNTGSLHNLICLFHCTYLCYKI
jgi:hypothetical protein